MSLLDALFRYDPMDKHFTDEARIQGMLDFEAALARAEAKCGIVPDSLAQIIASKCRAEHFDFAGIAKDAALSGNLAIPLIRKLTELVAQADKDAARFVHWGATSQDVIDTGCVLQVRSALDLIEQDLARLSDTLIALAEKHRATPVVARTWMKQALPTTFGFIVAGWLDAVTRHRSRFVEIIDLLQPFRFQPVETPLRVHRGFHETGLAQHSQVLGHGRLRHTKLTLDVSNRLL